MPPGPTAHCRLGLAGSPVMRRITSPPLPQLPGFFVAFVARLFVVKNSSPKNAVQT